MATVVTGQASGSLRGRSGWWSHGDRREEIGSGKEKNSITWELWEMAGENAIVQEMLDFVYVSQLIRRTD